MKPLTTAPLAPSPPAEQILDLREIDLRDGLFAGADLRDAELAHARLGGADLSGANLRGARLHGADLALCDLRGADLRGADLSAADLSGADLRDARLQGADLRDVQWAFSRIVGALGLPEDLRCRPQRDGRIDGPRGGDGEPLAGLRAFERGRRAHARGGIGEAERAYREALRWVPDSDAARYAMGCAALERGDAVRALRWWRAALQVHPGADRARLEATVLCLRAGEAEEAAGLLTELPGGSERLRQAVRRALGALPEAPEAAVGALAEVLGDCPAIRWWHRRAEPRPRLRLPGTIARIGDEEWVREERADLERLVRGPDRPVWVWHGAIARAITIGALGLAATAEQRLTRAAPEHRLWGLELRQLDRTREAFEALVRTRRQPPGAVRSIRWVALGAHGPTARIDCEAGVFYGKRYIGSTRPPASVAFTHRITRGMAAAGLRVSLPPGDRHGDDVMVFAGDLLVLYPELEGRAIGDDDLTEREAAVVGDALARVHEAGQGIAAGAGRPRHGLLAGSRILRHRSPDALFEATAAAHPVSAALLENHPLKGRLLSLVRAAGRRLRAVLRGCRATICHGDFGPGNVLIDQADRAGILDWDLCDLDLGVWDLARTIDRLAIRWPDGAGGVVEIRGGIARVLLAAYERRRPLHPHERAALPVLAAASRVDLDATVLALCTPVEEAVAEPLLDRMVVRLARAAAGAPEIAAALAR